MRTRVDNPPNPWLSGDIEWFGAPPVQATEVYEDHSKSILSRNESPDIPFRWSVNPYRGCAHGCAYCYARPTHEFLGFGAGTDFEYRLVVKPQAARLLRQAFSKRQWVGEVVVFSGNTDPYQPLEKHYRLTRACLEVCEEFRNPVAIITKAALIERDLELLARMAAQSLCRVTVSIPFFDPRHARAIEPHAPTPARRLRALEKLSRAGIPTTVNVAPIIPGLNDDQIPAILTAARRAGASSAGFILVRLPANVQPVFVSRLKEALPERSARVLSQLSDCRSGQLAESRFGRRMSGAGQRWEAIEALFRQTARRLGFQPPETSFPADSFRRPDQARQLSLL